MVPVNPRGSRIKKGPLDFSREASFGVACASYAVVVTSRYIAKLLIKLSK